VVAGRPSAFGHTDGSYIVYAADSPTEPERDIYIQTVAGGPVTQLAVAGEQIPTSISSGVITFLHVNPATSDKDLFVYVIATNTLFRITDTPEIEGASDVAVLPNGDVRVVWDADMGGGEFDVYATTFTPPSPPTFDFSGFFAPVQPPPTVNVAKAGGAIPVKFSLGGDRGLNIFSSGSRHRCP
jgi:hypothetical protein